MSALLGSLTGKAAVIWGGSAGIGFAVAKQLVGRSISKLILVGTTQSKLDDACAQLSAINAELSIRGHVCDMTDETSVQSFYASFDDKSIDHVIITAGRSAFLGNVVENKRTVADLKRQMDFKFFNQMCAVLNGHEKVVDGGSFVVFSGILAQRPGHGNTSLSIANAAVEASVKGLANDLGFARGIRINCVSPGMTDTDTYAKMDAEKKERYVQTCRERSPLHRIATPDDEADTVLFLITNPNVTGQVIMNDAGLSGV